MIETSVYKDIAKRTNGDVYIGVVGAVRTGKSTFIRKFMEDIVVPNIENSFEKERAIDCMPQSGSGKTVMTTEPKFIPDEAVKVSLGDGIQLSVKLIDCVGYPVESALGYFEQAQPRMVMTPWSEKAMSFEEASRFGTMKVISEHSTVAVAVTSDGSFGELERADYEKPEEEIIADLKKYGRPFVIVLNSAEPQSEEAAKLALSLESKYNAPVALINCLSMSEEDVNSIMSMMLEEFPIKEMAFAFPRWFSCLGDDSELKNSLFNAAKKCAANAHTLEDAKSASSILLENDSVESAGVERLDAGSGRVVMSAKLKNDVFYDIVSSYTGTEIKGEEDLMYSIIELSRQKRRFDSVAKALDEVEESGYGIIMPDVKDLKLAEPEIVKRQGSYGVKLRASAPSIHLIKADIETEINPAVGTEQQSEELVNYLMNEFYEDPKAIWNSNIFGKSLYDLVNEGLHGKLEHMSPESRKKLAETLQRIFNEGSGGLICIIL